MSKPDSHEFLVKTNHEVDEWMDSFYTDGRKAEFRSHCQWAWQEQERRKEELQETNTELKERLKELLEYSDMLVGSAVYKRCEDALKEGDK